MCGAVAKGAAQCPQSGVDHSAMSCTANKDQSNQKGMLRSLGRGVHIQRHLYWCDLSTFVRDAVNQLLQVQAEAPTLPHDWLERHGQDALLFGNESKPIAFWCALIDDWKIQALFDVTPGSGALMEACLTRGVQYYGVCHGLSLSTDV